MVYLIAALLEVEVLPKSGLVLISVDVLHPAVEELMEAWVR